MQVPRGCPTYGHKIYNFPGLPPKFCREHKEDGMLCVAIKKCVTAVLPRDSVSLARKGLHTVGLMRTLIMKQRGKVMVQIVIQTALVAV